MRLAPRGMVPHPTRLGTFVSQKFLDEVVAAAVEGTADAVQMVLAGGTSEGATKGWDTRGRGRHEKEEFVPRVRHATKEDFKELKEWYQKWGEVSFNKLPRGGTVERQAQAAQLADQIGDNKSPSDTFVVQGKDGIVGAMQLDMSSTPIEVNLLCAHPRVISGQIEEKGVGVRLMLQAAKVAANEGKGITLSALLNAFPFYQKLGMHQLSPGASTHYWTVEETKAMAQWDQHKH